MTRRSARRLFKIGKEACCLAAFAALSPFAGCGSADGIGAGDESGPGRAAPFASVTLSKPNGYRTLDNVSLVDVDGALAADGGVVVTQLSGPPMEFNAVRGLLYFLAPEEQFADSSSVLRLVNPVGREWQVTFNWSARFSSAMTRTDGPDSIALVASGIGVNGAIRAQTTAVSFRLSGMAGIDPASTQVYLRSPKGCEAIGSWFDWDGATETLAMKSARLVQFLANVRNAKTATLFFSFAKPGLEETAGFEQALTYASGSVSVAVKTAAGAAVTDMGGTRFVLRGFNSGMTAVGELSPAGVVSFDGLIADTYEIAEVLLAPGVQLKSFATLPTSNSTVNVTITRRPSESALGPRVVLR